MNDRGGQEQDTVSKQRGNLPQLEWVSSSLGDEKVYNALKSLIFNGVVSSLLYISTEEV
jgi:hypothetical protein